jgi:hypothetical protein
MWHQVNTGAAMIRRLAGAQQRCQDSHSQQATPVREREPSADGPRRPSARGLRAAPNRMVQIAIGLAAVLVGLLPGTVGAQTAPIHIPFYAAGVTDVCGVPVSYVSEGLLTLVYNPQTNTVTAVDHGYSALTGPNGKTLIDRSGDLQLITNVVSADGSQSYTWTLPSHVVIKLADGGVLFVKAGITMLTATVYPDGSVTSAVTLDKGPRPSDFCGPIITALTS